MIIEKRELTPEQIARAKKIRAERASRAPATTVASQSFIDRMTSGSADPDAARLEGLDKKDATT